MPKRRIAVAIPARDEASRLGESIASLLEADLDRRAASLQIIVLANNCRDGTAGVAAAFRARGAPVTTVEVDLEPERAHAGWARRLALDAGADRLTDAFDVLASTDADTRVEKSWLVRTLDHLDRGYDAVAGLARLCPVELRALPPLQRQRLAAIRRYENAMSSIKAFEDPCEPWPRHHYEGGASIALTLQAYQAIGGAPTPPVGEDRALFDRLRAEGFTIRHARDVRVRTSCRFDGRAPGGAADTLSRWALQGEEEDLGLTTLPRPDAGEAPLTFRSLGAEVRRLRGLARALRAEAELDLAV
jgi:cellulose synthase/poly-beta-1,6-N-acetylglucosamine synthase-like glycosyltransferase